MKRVYFIEYENKQILYIDFSNCTIEEVFGVIKEVKEVITSQPAKSVLTLSNVTGARYDERVIAGLKDLMIYNDPYVRKGAVVGMQQVERKAYDEIMYASKRLLLAFNNVDAAKDWLIDRRQFPRYKNTVKVEYSVIGKDNTKGEGVLKNISLGGICVSVNSKIERGKILTLKVNLFKDEPPLEIKGVVAWVGSLFGVTQEDTCILGIQFRDVSDFEHQKLFKYVLEFSKHNPPC